MSDRLNWDRDGHDWPNREASRFVSAGGVDWHVQVMGTGPVMLLIHGTGASTHSWRDVMARLALTHTVVAPDLPGHAFSSNPGPAGLSLPGMARSVGELLHALRLDQPVVVAGHSAGAAVLIRATLDRYLRPRAIVSINGALLPFGNAVGRFFSPIAKLMASAPLLPHLLSWRAENAARVARVIRGTGSRIEHAGLDWYARLLRSPAHVAGALGMMANWELRSLMHDLPALRVPLFLVVGGDDRAIPPQDAFKVRDIIPAANVTYLRGLGHLAHEEDPEAISEFIASVAKVAGLAEQKC